MRATTAVVLVAALVIAMVSPAAGAPRDRQPPTLGFRTQDQSVVAGAPGETDVTQVRGWARDKRSGIRRVTVTYCAGSKHADGSWTCNGTPTASGLSVTDARLSCNAKRRSCTWRAAVPVQPGSYLAFAQARDRAGRTRSVGPIQIYVA